MPKVKQTKSARLTHFVSSFGSDIFRSDGSVLFCKLCCKAVSAERRDQVTQHIASAKHQHALQGNSKAQQTLVSQTGTSTSSRNNEFASELCAAFVAANIPLTKLKNEVLRNFLSKYTKQNIPDESTLRKNYVAPLYEKKVASIRKAVGENNVWFSVDETTNARMEAVANFIIGPLTANEREAGTAYLLNSEVLSSTNHETVAKFIVDSLNLLWEGKLFNDRVQLALTDAAPYMCKSIKGLKILFPKLVHLTCLAHGTHRVAETIREIFPEVDGLISAVKKVYKKSPKRIKVFKVQCPGLRLPPSPVLTRWGTWLEAAVYYGNHFEEVKSAVSLLDSKDSTAITTAKSLFESEAVVANLAYISAHYRSIAKTIEKLETKGLPLVESVGLVKTLLADLEKAPGETGKIVLNKMQNVLTKNPGYEQISSIADVLSGETASLDLGLLPGDITGFKYAPITSCDVERSFSILKNILSDRRHNLTPEHLKHLLVLYSRMDYKNEFDDY